MWNEKFDRNLQNIMLTLMMESYPEGVKFISKSFASSWGTHTEAEISPDVAEKIKDHSEEKIAANLHYLFSHNVIEAAKIHRPQVTLSRFDFKLTEKGIDLMLDDGGLSAILGVVTIKFHDDTINKLIAYIHDSSASPQDKKKWSSILKDLPDVAKARLSEKIVDAGLGKMPDLLQWLGTQISHLG
ncbi:hypothetical protein [Serratia marcescens]|uniref:hypothetical protein n=1 Tax=Serratia marcescens TaxID=615 RepID=UPI000DF8D5B1|nr:hypothetical protein [Serratia marcescens]SUI38422.1 Uncharacterised protein [Serratia marcescens]